MSDYAGVVYRCAMTALGSCDDYEMVIVVGRRRSGETDYFSTWRPDAECKDTTQAVVDALKSIDRARSATVVTGERSVDVEMAEAS